MTGAPTSDDLIDAAAWAVVRGSLLFHLDLAQTLAEQALPAGAEPGGWAVDVGVAGYEVTFLADDLAHEVFAVAFAADGSPMGELRRGRAAPRATTLAAARRAVLARVAPASGWSAVALPPAADAAPGALVEAYLLRRGARPGDLPLEGHERVALSPDGRRVIDAAPVVAVRVPSEAHVYLSLKHGLALTVATPASGSRWRVEGERISRL